ncbi:MAG: hypothetical protein PHE50_09170 [Dehalococcoidales bacterium]|nr:hypothetical protein [Dehalococcoidales bacterium]
MKKINLTIGTIWQDRGNGKQFEVTGINKETGVIQLSNGDGYKTMTESSLRKNYKLIALRGKEVAAAPVVVKETVATEKATNDTPAPEKTPIQASEKSGRAAGGRVQLGDGKVIPGSKFIVDVCGKTREETYKADSPIRWLLKPAGQELLKTHGAKVVYGEPISK